MAVTVYGIPGCETVKKARRWLDERELDHAFHDYRKQGIDAAHLQAWCDEFGWEALLNKRGTTWRRLPESEREGLDESGAITLMQTHTSLIKRPVIEHANGRLLGFDADACDRAL